VEITMAKRCARRMIDTPKGGWEMDEELEESAIRETYEEAGVIGVLGPKLSEFHYETRKALRRLLLADNCSAETRYRNQIQFPVVTYLSCRKTTISELGKERTVG
jgi:8-oxo-dGTP pyrophosphatase MutT (NUDIX family)